MRFFIEFAYKGTDYHGWQRQPNASTVQEEIDNALSVLLNTKIKVIGAGRTDAGVHAKQMFAHFDCEVVFDIQNLINKLNGFLVEDIVIYAIFRVSDEANSRFDAISRTYQYHVIQKKDPFNKCSYFLHRKLDIHLMNIACEYILGEQDFTSFSKLNTQTLTNNCHVMNARWETVNNELVFTIQANRFLRNMVRALVGTLIDVGLGKIKPIQVKDIIAKKNRNEAGISVPAHALFLIMIEYPKDIFS